MQSSLACGAADAALQCTEEAECSADTADPAQGAAELADRVSVDLEGPDLTGAIVISMAAMAAHELGTNAEAFLADGADLMVPDYVYPVQTGTELHIPQIYAAVQTGTRLDLRKSAVMN